LAERVGCATRTLAAWESGRSSPTAAHLDAVLARAGLDLVVVDGRPEPAGAELRRHLQLSLTQRLRIALGESGVLAHPTRTPLWAALVDTARCGHVVLEPPVATALWLPLGQVRPVRASVFRATASLPRGEIECHAREGQAPASVIPVPLEGCMRVWVLPPAELARPTDEQALLMQADLVLAAEAPRDQAHRRRPAHRDPDASEEDWRLLHSKSVTRRPDLRDGRAWRLGATASLAQQLLGW